MLVKSQNALEFKIRTIKPLIKKEREEKKIWKEEQELSLTTRVNLNPDIRCFT